MEAILGIGGVVLLLALFGILTRIEEGRRRRMLRAVTQPAKVRRYDLSGELLPAEETSSGPVRYDRLPAAPVAYLVEQRRAQYQPTVKSAFIVPLLTATFTAVSVTLAAGVLALAFGWPAKVVLLTFPLALLGAWTWRLGWADRMLYAVERVTHTDLDGDGYQGAPMTSHLAAVQPEAARADVARQTRQTADGERLAWLQSFVHRCYAVGCSESAQGIKPGERARYLEARDLLLRLGLAEWRDAANKRLGWGLVADEPTAIAIIAEHVTEL
jgi:hypothetical protein